MMSIKPETVTKEKQIEIYRERIPAALRAFFVQFLNDNESQKETVIDDYIIRAPQNRYNAGLMYICKTVFQDRKPLFFQAYKNTIPGYENSISRVYDPDIVSSIAELYIYLCHRYDKDISIYGFSLLTGINSETIKLWYADYKNGSSLNGGPENVSRKHFEIAKRIAESRQESLTGMLTSGRHNVVGTLAALNHLYGWNEPGRPADDASPAALPAAALPRFDSVLSIQRPELPAADDAETL